MGQTVVPITVLHHHSNSYCYVTVVVTVTLSLNKPQDSDKSRDVYRVTALAITATQVGTHCSVLLCSAGSQQAV